jgi:hypothetical protein
MQTDWKQHRNNRHRNSKKKNDEYKQPYVNISSNEQVKPVDTNIFTESLEKSLKKSLEKSLEKSRGKLLAKCHLRPNRISKTSNCSYDTWEFFYFKYILDLYEIFLNGMNQLNLGIDVNSIDTFDKFSKFIRQCSSGEISPYLESIENTELESLYNEFTIKRNKL